MGDKTKIEWADATWNPVTGCTKVSPGCDHCYIDRTPPFRIEGRRFDQPGTGGTTGVRLHPERLDQPLRWKKPRRVFVNSLSDLFHDDVPDEYIARIFAVMALAPQHRFMVLTKRHGRMRSLLNSAHFRALAEAAVRGFVATGLPERAWFAEWPLPNVWLGVTVEDQKRADLRIPALLDTPAAVRFLSCEPLLGPVSLSFVHYFDTGCRGCSGLVSPAHEPTCGTEPGPHWGIDWVIVGGESGPNARPMHPEWARTLRDQCIEAGVPFFFKQWGDGSLWVDRLGDVWAHRDNGLMESFETAPFPREHVEKKWVPLKQLSKRGAGRELDGRTWDEEPS